MSVSMLALLLAAQNPVSTAREIVVTAPRQGDEATVQRFVRDVSVTTNGQIATFRAPVCPAVFGLPQQYGQRVADRIRLVAGQAGLPVAAAGCTPNVTLIVANNSTRAIEEMQRLNPRLFNGLPPGEYRQLTRGRQPVRAWSLTEVRNEDGSDFVTDSSDERGSAGAGGGDTLRVSSSSIIGLPTQRLITQSVVVMEEQATIGKTLSQIADYVAVRALTGARPGDAGGQGNSILSLFGEGAAAPRSITSLDLAYLRALQRTRGNQRAVTHMGRIARFISSEVGQTR